ncbi:MAG: hypothetical protein RLP14_09905 [Owenweeksia sp.]
MSIPFSISPKVLPSGIHKGQKRYYARARMRGTLSLERLSERMSQRSTLSRTDIQAVLYGLTEMIPEILEAGYGVELGPLGRLRISVGSAGHALPGEVSARSIRRPRMVFKPGKPLRERMKLLKFSPK